VQTSRSALTAASTDATRHRQLTSAAQGRSTVDSRATEPLAEVINLAVLRPASA
jgi:hypothetical protein